MQQPMKQMPKLPIQAALGFVMKNFGTLLAVVAAFLIGVLWTQVRYLKQGYGVNGTAAVQPATQQQAAAQPAQAAQKTVTIDQIRALFDGKHITFGKKDSKLVFYEISDPSCPFCHIAGGENLALNAQAGAQFKTAKDGGTYVPPVLEMRKLVDAGQAAFVWSYYPGHGNGEMGAKALYCAFEQGKFWQVHDLLMSEKGYEIMDGTDINQQPTKGPIVKNDKTKSGDLAEFLKSAIDPGFMKSCLDSGKYDQTLTADTSLATGTFGIQGTPGFFVNTTSFNGAYSFKDMQSAVDAALK